MKQDIKSDIPTHDRLIAQINNLFVYNLNKSFPDEEFEKGVESRYYLKIDKISSQNKLFEHSFLVLWLMEFKIKSVSKNMVPFVYLNENGTEIGTELEPKELIKLIRNKNIKLTYNFLRNPQENFDLLSIAYTIKDRLKEDYLPIIIKIIKFEEEYLKKNEYEQYIQTSVNYFKYNPLDLTFSNENQLITRTNTVKMHLERKTVYRMAAPKVSTHIRLKNL